jgi:hypothetical protein
MLAKVDQMRDRCEAIYEGIDEGLAEDRDVDALIDDFEKAIREYEGLQEEAPGELQKMEAELKSWAEQSNV